MDSHALTDSKYNILPVVEIPEHIYQSWQKTVNLMAQLVDVPAALIMKVHAKKIEVLVRSANPENVYHPGEMADLDTGLYCETVMSNQDTLLVANCLEDIDWQDNPDVELGMISYLGMPLNWPDGRVFGTVCVLDNKTNPYNDFYIQLVTQFKEHIELSLHTIFENNRLRAMQTELSNIQEALQDYLFTCNSQFQITYANHSMLNELGYDQEKLVGKTLSDIFCAESELPNPNQVMSSEQVTKRLNDSGRVENSESKIKHANGSTRDVYLTVSQINIGNDLTKKYVCLAKDITQTKALEQQLITIQTQLAHEQKLAAIGELSAGLSHELGQPLGIIYLSIDMLQDELNQLAIKLPDIVAKSCERISNQVSRAKSIIDNLGAFSRQQILSHPESFEINKVIELAVDDIQQVDHPCRATIKLELSEHLPKLSGNITQIGQLISNLLRNALDELASLKAEQEPQVVIRTFLREGKVRVEVEDNGSGVKAENIGKVFTPFFTTKGPQEGTGLGLAICYSIAKNHGGQLLVCNRDKSGACFTLILPVKEQS